MGRYRRIEGAWSAVEPLRDAARGRILLRQAFAGAMGDPLHLVVRGSAMQIAVWRALLEIPEGSVANYTTLAAAIGAPGAVRAVASRVGDSPIASLIPCHRVVRATGLIAGYRWGTGRKVALLARELGRRAGLAGSRAGSAS